MKIAIVHDYIKEYGGAERVLEALHEIWPEAPVYTSVYLPDFLGPHKERFKNWDIKTSFLQYISFKEKLISPFRIIAPFMFKMFDLSKFDIVIVSATGAYFPNMIRTKKSTVIARRKERATRQSHTEQGIASPLRGLAMTKREGAIHICYCHTPPRYLYGYATAREWKKNLVFRVIGEIANHFLRLIDFKSTQNVDYFIANSQNVKARIKKFYRREAEVIYPPVDIALGSLRLFDESSGAIDNRSLSLAQAEFSKNASLKSSFKNSSQSKARPAKNYYLAGGRLARPKHIDLIVKACEELRVPLKVFGRGFGGYEKELGISNQESGRNGHNSSFMIHNSYIDFVGEVTDKEKLELMRNAKAYIFAAEDEDFGITPVEAMSVGTPVIAYRSGGVVESIINGKTGLFFDELTVESLAKAMKQFNNLSADRQDLTIDSDDCIKQAQKFSKERFKREIKELVEQIAK